MVAIENFIVLAWDDSGRADIGLERGDRQRLVLEVVVIVLGELFNIKGQMVLFMLGAVVMMPPFPATVGTGVLGSPGPVSFLLNPRSLQSK